MACNLHQAPLSTGFSRQEYWSGLPFPSPGDLPDPRDRRQVSHIADRCFTLWATREASNSHRLLWNVRPPSPYCTTHHLHPRMREREAAWDATIQDDMKPHLSWATDCHSGKGEENSFSVTLDLGTLCILDGRLKYWKVVQAFHRWIGGGMATISPLESPNHGILSYERGEQTESFFHKVSNVPGGSAGKESVCNGGDLGSIPRLGRSPGEWKGYPLQYFGLENSMDCIVHGVTKSRTRLSYFHFKCSLGPLSEIAH